MSFASTRQGCQIYLLKKGAQPQLDIVSVSQVSERMAMPGTGYVYPPRTVVNITVDTHPQQTTFQGVPTDTDIYYCENGQTVMAATKEAMNNELTNMMRRSEEVIRSVENHRVIIESCNKLLNQLNPERGEKAKQDEEIATIKTELSMLSERNQRIEALLERALQAQEKTKDNDDTNYRGQDGRLVGEHKEGLSLPRQGDAMH